MSSTPTTKRLLLFAVLGVAVGGLVLFVYTQARGPRGEGSTSAEKAPPSASESGGGQLPGQLRQSGLRLQPSGRSDASAVLDPGQFARPEVQRAYAIARRIPATLNQLYCWCGCETRGVHRSNLACFEDRMGAGCGVCRGTAEIAYRMRRNGTTDPAKIQAAVDEKLGPRWARRQQQNRQRKP